MGRVFDALEQNGNSHLVESSPGYAIFKASIYFNRGVAATMTSRQCNSNPEIAYIFYRKEGL